MRILVLLALLLASCAAVPEAQRPYTIMIYMNGSDLETEVAAGTTDLLEMLESGLCSQKANVIVFTGGTLYWQNDRIPADECALWQVADGQLIELERVGVQNMGDPDTLTGFIRYAVENFPAARYGLIMWDHGGGTIAGFGHDEKFEDNGGSLTLTELCRAFRAAGLAEQRLEFLGFDACLMATVEMALIAAPYAKYLIASEDLEPGDGWDYAFLNVLNQVPPPDGDALGIAIVDTFMDFYGPDSDEILTLSVVDLDKVQPIIDAMGALMTRGSEKLQAGNRAFATLASRRRRTKTFGEGSPRDNEIDMVDIGDMAKQLSDFFPTEAEALHRALAGAVLYNRHNAAIPLYGLSAYYIYGGRCAEAVALYEGLAIDQDYTAYLVDFWDHLAALPPAGHRRGNGRWASLDDRPVFMYRTTQLGHATQYALPAQINGRAGDVIVAYDENSRSGRVLGYRHTDEGVMQKGFCPLTDSCVVELTP